MGRFELAGEPLRFPNLLRCHLQDQAVQCRSVAASLSESQGNPFVSLNQVAVDSGASSVRSPHAELSGGQSSFRSFAYPLRTFGVVFENGPLNIKNPEGVLSICVALV